MIKWASICWSDRIRDCPRMWWSVKTDKDDGRVKEPKEVQVQKRELQKWTSSRWRAQYGLHEVSNEECWLCQCSEQRKGWAEERSTLLSRNKWWEEIQEKHLPAVLQKRAPGVEGEEDHWGRKTDGGALYKWRVSARNSQKSSLTKTRPLGGCSWTKTREEGGWSFSTVEGGGQRGGRGGEHTGDPASLKNSVIFRIYLRKWADEEEEDFLETQSSKINMKHLKTAILVTFE